MSGSRPQRQSWKQASRETRQSAGPTRSSRWLFTLLAVTLVVLLGWLVIKQLRRADRTHFVALVAGQHAKLSVPSLPFGQHDLGPLRDEPHDHLDYYDLSELMEADRVGQLGQQLARLELGERDTLILYVSAHGVAHLASDRPAELLCRDFDIQQPGRAGLTIDELLRALQQSAAERKLLLLDTGYLPTDTRLGLLVNEFPREARRVIEQATPADVWVLLSNRVLQANTVAQPHAVFGQSVVDGLLGAANSNSDPRVDLVELFAYVAARCRHESGGLQTVQLLRAGQSLTATEALPELPLLVVDRPLEPAADSAADPAQQPPAEPPSAADPPPASASTAATSTHLVAQAAPADAPVTTSSNAQPPSVPPPSDAPPSDPPPSDPQSAATGSTSAPAVPPNPPTDQAPKQETAQVQAIPSNDLRSRLDEVWRLRDQLQAISAEPADWLPLEYAPQLWRETNRLLLDSELWLLSGPSPSLALQIDRHIEGLRRLGGATGAAQTTDTAPGGTGGELVTDRLLRAEAEFLKSPARQQFEPASPALRPVARDLRRLRRLMYFLPEYVRWYGLASLATPDDDAQLDSVLAEQIDRLMVGCRELTELVRTAQNRPLSATLPNQLRDRLDQLDEIQQQLHQALDRAASQAIARAEVPAYRRQIAVLLQTSLPSLEQRVALRTALQHSLPAAPEQATDATAADRARSANAADVSATQWRRLQRRWQMEEGLLRLAAPQFSLGPPPASYQDSDAVWSQLRVAGARLRDAYRQLDAASGEFATGQLADRMQLVDGRDAPRMSRLDQGFPLLNLMPPLQPVTLQMAWSGGSEVPLQTEWTDLQLDLSTTSVPPLSVTLGFQFDESALQLQTASGQSIRVGDYPPFELQSQRQLSLKIRAIKQAQSPADNAVQLLSVVARGANVREQAELRCLLPRPNQIELVATRLGGEQPELSVAGEDQMIQLRAFPNRTSHYRLQLRNLSGVDKSVQVRLVAIPQLARAAWPPGRILGPDQRPQTLIVRSLFEPAGRRLLPQTNVVAQTSTPLTLPGDGSVVDLTFAAEAAPDAAATPPAAAATPAAPPAEPPAIDISAGLLCVIEDGTEQWRKWIELQAIPPRDYVRVDVGYDLQRLTIGVRPGDAAQLPLGLEQEPVPVAWEIDRLIEGQFRVGDRVETGSLAGDSEHVALYADVTSTRDRPASVRLSVDRYPRAFIFEVPLDRRSQQDAPRRDLPELVVQSLAMSKFPRVYATSAAEQRRLLAERPSDDQREIVLLQPGEIAAFPKPELGDQLEIRLRADAAVSAFGRADTDDRIVLQLTDRLGTAAFQTARFADRQASFHLLPIADGRLGVQTRVDDHRIVTAPQRMEGDYQLVASMQVAGEELRYPRIPIVFDGQPPQVLSRLAVTPIEVEVGKPIAVSFDVEDESGIAKIEVGLVKTLADPLDDKSKTVLERPRESAVRLTLTGAEPGPFWVKALVTDRVGRVTSSQPETPFAPVRVVIQPPAEKKDPVPQEIVGRVFGTTQIRDRKIDQIDVWLKGERQFGPYPTTNGGQFEFLEVPAGKYKLEAAGYWNGERVGEQSIEFKAPGDYLRPIQLQLTAKPREEKK